MKSLKYIVIALIFGGLVTSCEDSLEDVFNELGKVDGPIVSDLSYELTDADFSGIDSSTEGDFYEAFKGFPNFDDALENIPSILAENLPREENAKVLLNIDVVDLEIPTVQEQIEELLNAQEIELEVEDYPTVNSGAFLPLEDGISSIETLLESKVMNPVEGQKVLVKYKNFTEEPVPGSASIDFNFQDSFEGWTAVNEEGDGQSWSSLSDFIEMSGFGGMPIPNNDWLISPEIDLTGQSNLKFQIEQVISFSTQLNLIKILVSENYTGDVNTTVWDEINLATTPDGTGSDFVLSEDFDFSAYDDKVINLAFNYRSTSTTSARWRINFARIKFDGTGNLEGPTENQMTYFEFDGSGWSVPNDITMLTAADYDAMGTEFGRPGRFDSFSSSVLPEDFLSTFLTTKFPFVQERDRKFLVYRFFEGGETGTVTRIDLYSFEENEWGIEDGIERMPVEIRFKFKDGVWISDNATRYTFTESDYNLIVAELVDDADLSDEVGNLDRFGNFNRATSATGWDDAEVLKAVNVVLRNNFPDTEEGEQFLLTYLIFDGSTMDEELTVILGSNGNYTIVTE